MAVYPATVAGTVEANTARIANKAWFIALLLSGVFSLGFIAMIAYLLAGPDGTIDARRKAPQVPGTVLSA